MADEDYKAKLQSLGFSARGKRDNRTKIIGDEGPYRGHQVGIRTDHWDGSNDATVTRPFVEHNLNKKGHS